MGTNDGEIPEATVINWVDHEKDCWKSCDKNNNCVGFSFHPGFYDCILWLSGSKPALDAGERELNGGGTIYSSTRCMIKGAYGDHIFETPWFCGFDHSWCAPTNDWTCSWCSRCDTCSKCDSPE